MPVPRRARARAAARRTLGGVAAHLPAAGVRRLAQVARPGPSLSAVVLVTDDNVLYLDECVAGLRQAGEVLLVVTGTATSTRTAVDRHRTRSWRVRVVEQPAATRAEALTLGAGRVGGDLLVLLDAGDRVVDGALDALSAALGDADVDVAGGTASDIGRLQLGDLVVRRSILGAVEIPEGRHQEWWTAARLVLAARRAVPGPSLRTGARRGSGVAFGTMPLAAPEVGGWWAAVEALLGGLDPGRPVREHVLRWLLDEELPVYLEDAERCTPQEWSTLVSAARTLVDAVPERTLADLHVESRVRAWLAADAARPQLERYNADRWLEDGQFGGRLEGGVVHAELPVTADRLPQRLLALGPTDTPLEATLRTVRRAGSAQVELGLFVVVRRVSSATPSDVSVRVARPDGREVESAVDQRADPEVNVWAGDRFTDHTGHAFTATLDAADLLRDTSEGDRLRVVVEMSAGGVRRVGGLTSVELRGSAGRPAALDPSGLTLRPRRGAGDRWDLVVARVDEPGAASAGNGWSATEVRLDDGAIVVSGTGTRPAVGTVRLVGAAETQPVDVRLEDGVFEARIALVHDGWSLGPRALPSGSYRVRLEADGAAGGPMPAGPVLTERTPHWLRSSEHRVRVQRGLDGSVLLTLAAPLADNEVGPYAQQQLRRWYVCEDHRVDPRAVYLQSYTGQAATDSPLAIHHALRRLRPDLRLHWAVADRSTLLPEGAHPMLLRSRDWYAALATAGFLVTNIDMDPWFVKRPGQRLLQTFHGYPAKTMGVSAWTAKNFTPLRVERQLRRTSGTWDLLLTPTPEMDVHYRREYRYDGPILAAGYPRDDVLVGQSALEVREATRRRLGISAGQRVVLFAPTWRDDLATNFRAAAMSTAFDPVRAARDLGEDVVVLLRGHRFHRHRDAVGSQLLDVTDYPEINDLILASDVAVLDYTSLRFDFALTGRPMVFVVPDLDRYTGGVRGFLFDFRASAPGPLTSDTAEAIAWLRDLDGLLDAHRADLELFNRTYSPRQDGHSADRVVREFFGAASDEDA